MMTFRDDKLRQLALPMSIGWAVGEIGERVGRQESVLAAKRTALPSLAQRTAIISTESSTRIEGVTAASERLEPLLDGRVEQRDRDEDEIRNYRRAFEWVSVHAATVRIEPALFLELHQMVKAGVSDAGAYKERMNEIVERGERGSYRVLFTPVTPENTPAAMDELCLLYRHALNQWRVPRLVLDAALILDFLAIHPFADGDGRVARLASLVLLEQVGIRAWRYASFERIIERDRDDYYQALRASQADWHSGRHDPLRWIAFYLHVTRRLFDELESGPADFRVLFTP